MTDKPTLKEYLRFRNMSYVRTFDGRYFKIANLYFTFPLLMIVALLLAAPSLIMLYIDVRWHSSISHDLIILFVILSLFLPRLIYRFEKFELLQPGSEKYQKASTREYWGRLTAVITAVLIISVNSVSSFSLSYLRSLADTPETRCSISWAKGEDRAFDLEEGDRIIMLPAQSDRRVGITIKLYHTPYAPELTLDGKVIDYDFGEYSGDWTYLLDNDYFSQKISAKVPAADIHDGSVLTLTCGKWSYEWTFVSGSP